MKYENQDLLNLYTKKVEEHWYTMFDPILKYLGNVDKKSILDIGCGSWELTYFLSKTAKEVIGIDSSQKWIDYCKSNYKNENLGFIKTNADNLKKFNDGSFDVVIINMVFSNIYNQKEIKSILSEVNRVTKKSCDFVFSDLHPVCIMSKGEWNRRQEYSKDFSYFKDGSKYFAIVQLSNKKEIKFENSFWSSSFYSEKLDESGFYIKKIIESNYPDSTPKKFYRYSFPEYIIYCCKKAL